MVMWLEDIAHIGRIKVKEAFENKFEIFKIEMSPEQEPM